MCIKVVQLKPMIANPCAMGRVKNSSIGGKQYLDYL
jgi:hypothetical protein